MVPYLSCVSKMWWRLLIDCLMIWSDVERSSLAAWSMLVCDVHSWLLKYVGICTGDVLRSCRLLVKAEGIRVNHRCLALLRGIA